MKENIIIEMKLQSYRTIEEEINKTALFLL